MQSSLFNPTTAAKKGGEARRGRFTCGLGAFRDCGAFGRPRRRRKRHRRSRSGVGRTPKPESRCKRIPANSSQSQRKQQDANGSQRFLPLCITCTVCEATHRHKLERLCRYVTRPAIANEQLSTNERGQVIHRFKQPFAKASSTSSISIPQHANRPPNPPRFSSSILADPGEKRLYSPYAGQANHQTGAGLAAQGAGHHHPAEGGGPRGTAAVRQFP